MTWKRSLSRKGGIHKRDDVKALVPARLKDEMARAGRTDRMEAF